MQDDVVSQARDYTSSMSSVWETTSSQDIGTFYDAIKVVTQFYLYDKEIY
ncbi:MAG: hypothetical protein U9N63_01985 [Pseudomonadota bacterium]|nr:hypothetical protein [Pseudomonadota bacterium]